MTGYLALREDDVDMEASNGYLKDRTDAMVKLAALTELISDLGSLTITNSGNYAEYNVENGVGVGRGLLKKPEIAIQDMVFSAGAKFPEHTHEELEVLIVYKGKIRGKLDGKELELNPKDVMVIQPGESHEFEFVTKARVVAITMPSNKDFPDDKG